MFFGKREKQTLEEILSVCRKNQRFPGQVKDRMNTLESAVGSRMEALDERMQSRVDALEERMQSRMDALEESAGIRIGALEKAAGKHDIVQEDLSDTLAELREQQEASLRELRGVTESLCRERMQREQEREENLLSLVMEYERNLLSIERLLADNAQWTKQFEMIRRSISQKGLAAGIVLLGKEGELVDYDLYEVEDVRETSDPGLDRCVAQVYETGYQYHGRIQKARVSAWKYTLSPDQPQEKGSLWIG